MGKQQPLKPQLVPNSEAAPANSPDQFSVAHCCHFLRWSLDNPGQFHTSLFICLVFCSLRALLLEKCLHSQNMPCAWVVSVPGCSARLPGPPTPNPWKWWNYLVSSLWPRRRRHWTGIQITTPILPLWGHCVFLASTETNIRILRMSSCV